MATTQGYSTLEWNPRQPHEAMSGIEVNSTPGVNRWDDEGRYLQPDTKNHHKPPGESYELSDGQPPSSDTDAVRKGRGRKFCGLSRRIFITVLVVCVLVVIGATAGGVAGGLQKGESPSKSAQVVGSMLDTTRLAAANRTINGSMQHTVLFQDGNGVLMTRYRMTTSSEWKSVNLTLKFASSKEEERVELPPGAPLAALSCADWGCGDTMVVYLGTDRIRHGIRDDSERGSVEWYPRTSVATANLSASLNSQLAASISKSFYDDEEGFQRLGVHRLLAYQDSDGHVFVSNDSNKWVPTSVDDHLPNLTTGTSLAIISQLRGVELDRVSLVSKVTGRTDAASTEYAMLEATYPLAGTNDTWTRGSEILDGIMLPELSAAESKQQFAVTMRNNSTESVYLILSYNGTISGRIIGPRNETIPNIQLRESGELKVANFSAIATTMDGFLYGFINDTISEYSFDASDSSILNFEGIVYDKSVSGT
ncbi:unnamed protein product [Colletotrichum noveboracense]|uniref:Fucose-specific lectin n=1 Tax=Colletotrichum noveboracense TaxID=2664923 RepID=A0A9W4WGR2_9PEZI|nr:unnamed protein product [Colletotrichum noveboracense]